MIPIRDYLAEKQKRFSFHPFFQLIEENAHIHLFKALFPKMAFWILTFQDILRLNAERVENAEYVDMVEAHKREDANHDIWFLHDYMTINYLVGNIQPGPIDQSILFDRQDTGVRDASFGLISEVFHIRDDRLRVILMLILESTGHVFFAKIAKAMQKLNIDQKLEYFSSSHLDVEKAHSCFGDEMEEQINAIALDAASEEDAKRLTDRAYNCFIHMFDALVIDIKKTLPIATPAASYETIL